MASSTSSIPKAVTSLRVGVLLIPPVQLLDAAALDVFGMLSPEYLTACGLPQPLLDLAIPVSIHYINGGSAPDSHVPMTSSATLPVTDTLTSPAVQPGQLDVLLIPGPDPNLVPNESVLDFIRGHEKANSTDFLVICTGSFPAGYAGLLDGKRVTGPRGLMSKLKSKFPDAQFVDRRWERDGRVWTSGAYCCFSLQTFSAHVIFILMNGSSLVSFSVLEAPWSGCGLLLTRPISHRWNHERL
jgi:transcriptional regulator GlxA family with amidase domain